MKILLMDLHKSILYFWVEGVIMIDFDEIFKKYTKISYFPKVSKLLFCIVHLNYIFKAKYF